MKGGGGFARDGQMLREGSALRWGRVGDYWDGGEGMEGLGGKGGEAAVFGGWGLWGLGV